MWEYVFNILFYKPFFIFVFRFPQTIYIIILYLHKFKSLMVGHLSETNIVVFYNIYLEV